MSAVITLIIIITVDPVPCVACVTGTGEGALGVCAGGVRVAVVYPTNALIDILTTRAVVLEVEPCTLISCLA
jgi:hypothetical protein